jgi:hypothetical protein
MYKIDTISDINGCVYKLWYANKYVIIKAKTLIRSLEIVEDGLNRFIKNTPKGRKETDIYYKLNSHVLNNPFQKFNIEILFQSDNPLLLLKREQLELNIAKEDYRCVNHSFDAYIPKFTQVNGKKSWINRGYYLNFMQWKRTLPIN